ncbi:MAG: diguanylate cyclase [Thalassobaculum sp.]|uniref:diguanylate cyclase n=1 Tax=Thalassobaculum sp. TaxID=2022740 RepID=UPI0032EEE3C1
MIAGDADSHRHRYDRIVSAVERAGAEVDDRLARFHRSAICKVRPDPDLLKLGAHGSSSFGLWYEERKDAPPVDQPAFGTLVALHEALLNHIALLAERAWKDARVPVQEYDALLEKVTAFNELAGRLTRAFQAAISDIDPLTGTQTRQVMLRDLKRELQRARRAGTPGCLALADVDRFKSINDGYGHAVGDMVLAAVAGLLIESLRPYDSVYRYGGEEFLLCLPETGPEEARRVLERVRGRVAGQSIALGDGRSLSVTVSFGLTLMTPRRPIEELIDRADKALYLAKENGRDRVEVWRPEAPDARA